MNTLNTLFGRSSADQEGQLQADGQECKKQSTGSSSGGVVKGITAAVAGERAASALSKGEKEKNHETIVQGLVNGRVRWHEDNVLLNIWFFLCQRHVILGMFFSHKEHPYTRLERIGVWLSLVAASFGLSLLLSDSKGEKDSNVYARLTTQLVAVYLAIKNVILYNAACCSCVQDGAFLEKVTDFCGYNELLKSKAESAGLYVLIVSWTISACWLLLGMTVGREPGMLWEVVVEDFVASQVLSWILGVGTLLLTFGKEWFGCGPCCPILTDNVFLPEGKSDQVRAKIKKKYPHGIEYPNDENMMWGGDRSRCNALFEHNTVCLVEDADGNGDAESHNSNSQANAQNAPGQEEMPVQVGAV